jgi:hypothetical protein
MDKMWIIKSRFKTRLCKTENDLIKRINVNDESQEVLEYTLASKTKSSDFFKVKERDTQLKCILGELDPDEENILKFIRMYEEIAPEGEKMHGYRGVKSTKEFYLLKLNMLKINKKYFKNFIVNDKKYFLSISNNVDWLKTILLVHNFNNCTLNRPSSSEYYEELKKNFILANNEIKRAKKSK